MNLKPTITTGPSSVNLTCILTRMDLQTQYLEWSAIRGSKNYFWADLKTQYKKWSALFISNTSNEKADLETQHKKWSALCNSIIIIEDWTLKHSIRNGLPSVPKSNFYGIDIIGENSRHTSFRVSFCFHLHARAYKEFSKTIDKLRILKLNTKPKTRPFIIDTGRTFTYIIFGPNL